MVPAYARQRLHWRRATEQSLDDRKTREASRVGPLERIRRDHREEGSRGADAGRAALGQPDHAGEHHQAGDPQV
jgi:hypothetical protein